MTHTPPGYSLVNPFDASKVPDFNVWMTLMGVLGLFYRTMAWQNQSAYQTASLTAHESRMGNIMTNWRTLGQGAVITLLAVCALTYLHHPAFAAQARVVMADVHSIPQPQIQEQMTLPLAVTHMLPVGVRGALCVVLMMGVFGGDGTHLLSWGSIFIQDCVLPLRRTPFTPRQHIILLRWSMIGVALFAFVFGSFFHQTEYIPMWWAVTEAIFVGGAGCAIIGGLYWKKGTTAGAWAGAVTGSILATGSILLRVYYGDRFPLNGIQISFFGSIIAMAVYAGVSLLTCHEDYNMDRLLHRGRYAIASEQKAAPKFRDGLSWSRLIGIDEHFSRGDKWITGGLFGWSLLWLAVFCRRDGLEPHRTVVDGHLVEFLVVRRHCPCRSSSASSPASGSPGAVSLICATFSGASKSSTSTCSTTAWSLITATSTSPVPRRAANVRGSRDAGATPRLPRARAILRHRRHRLRGG